MRFIVELFQFAMHQRGDLTRDSQLIYLSQWLGEFSDVEKDDFLQHLLDVYAPGEFFENNFPPLLRLTGLARDVRMCVCEY